MAVNVVKYGNQTVMDISDSTTTSDNLLSGEVGYSANGNRVVGALTIPDELNDLGDVNITQVVDGQVLKYNSTTQKWENSNESGGSGGLTLLAYGKSTWNDFITAYTANKIVYCRASSNNDPSTGSQTRMAFMAYVNNETTPTQVEFQYYRSVSSHSDSQQGDQVYVYTLKNTNAWSVTVRNAFTKIKAGTNMTSSYSSGTLTLNSTASGGSTVSVSQKTSSGTNIADITVDGTTTQLYAPSGDSVSVTQKTSSGTNIADITVNGTTTQLYAPNGGGSDVSVTQKTTEGTNIADITVDGTTTQLYAPTAAIPVASTSVLGGVKVDGNTITIDNGVISSHTSGSSSTLNGLTDVNVPLPQNGQVLTYDSNNHQWVSANCPSGGMFPHLVITSDTRSVVTVVKGQTTLTPTETSAGIYEVDVNDWGDWTVTSVLDGDTITVIAHVDEVKEIKVDARHFWATITVTYPTGSVVTCAASGEETLYATGDSPYTFMVHAVKEWVISRDFRGDIDRQTVNIVAKGQHEDVDLDLPLIFTLNLNTYSGTYERGDICENFTFSASVGDVTGHSDFDDFYPWSEMQRVTIGQDVMVKIPKFYVKYIDDAYYHNLETISITDRPRDGYTIHPAFIKKNIHGVETEYDYIYVGAYETSAGFVSQSAKAPLTNLTRAEFRTGSKKQAGFYQCDMDTFGAIRLLMLIEMGGSNSQLLIGDGYTCESSSASGVTPMVTGSCDNVPNLTGRPSGQSNEVGVVYRGLENLWGNVNQFADGCLLSSGQSYFFCNDPETYADTYAGCEWYENASFSNYDSSASFSSGRIGSARMHYLQNVTRMVPYCNINGSSTQGLCDYIKGPYSGVEVSLVGGGLFDGQSAGIFYTISVGEGYKTEYTGSRLMYIPQEPVEYDLYISARIINSVIQRNDARAYLCSQIEIDLENYRGQTITIVNYGDTNRYTYHKTKPYTTGETPLDGEKYNGTGVLEVTYTGGEYRYLVYDFTSSNESTNVLLVTCSG